MFLSLQFKEPFFFSLKQKVIKKSMGDSILGGYVKADLKKMLLLIFAPEYVEDDKPCETTKS